MKILAIDTDSNALDFLMRAKLWGHDVRWWDAPRKDGSERRAGEGIITKIRDYDALWSKWVGWADLIYLPGNNRYMEKLEPYRRMGYPVYGGGVESTSWEADRAVGQGVMKEAGLQIIPGKEFHEYDDAIAHVKRHRKPFVSKPSGEADKALSYVANSAADLIYMLNRWSGNEKYVASARECGFILQEKKLGCEMGVSGWYGPGGWSSVIEEAFEFKKLMDGDLGVNTGEQGTLTRFVKQSKLFDVALKPMTGALRSIDYMGCINVNGCIDEAGGFWPFEFTMREGWPATHNQFSLHEGDPAKWMLDLINGYDTRRVRFNEASISVVVSIPEYPYSHLTQKEVEGIPVWGATDMDHIHLCEVMLGEAPTDNGTMLPCYLTAGDYVLVATGCGETITGARRSAYTAIQKIRIPNSPQWRLDIGRSKLVEALPKVQRLGFARGLSY